MKIFVFAFFMALMVAMIGADSSEEGGRWYRQFPRRFRYLPYQPYPQFPPQDPNYQQFPNPFPFNAAE